MLAFGLLAMLAFAGQQTVVHPVVVHSADAVRCKDGVVAAPNGPFAVWVFCEDTLGTQIAVVYARNMGAPNDGPWGLNNRFWQDGAWTSEVQTFAWSPDGTSLFVSTGAVYGSSGLFGVLPKVLLTARSLESLPPGIRPGSASQAPSVARGCCSPRSSR